MLLSLETTLKKKCEGYKRQDKIANRTIPTDNYVDADWFMKNVKADSCCFECGCGLTISTESGVSSNITAQRMDNSISHTIDNCMPMCLRCNCAAK